MTLDFQFSLSAVYLFMQVNKYDDQKRPRISLTQFGR